MRVEYLFHSAVAAVFGLCALGFGVAETLRIGNAQEALDAKLESIRAGAAAPETLVVVRKYVNPGRNGRAHVVFRSERMPKVDQAATTDFFNSVQPGDAVTGYYFPDGYLLPANLWPSTASGRWFLLLLGGLLGALGLYIAVRLQTLPRRRPAPGPT